MHLVYIPHSKIRNPKSKIEILNPESCIMKPKACSPGRLVGSKPLGEAPSFEEAKPGGPVGPFARLPGRSFEEAKPGGPVCRGLSADWYISGYI